VRNVLGCAAFLTVLRTRRISRSLPLIPQRIPASPAVVSATAGPAPHSHPANTRMQRAAPSTACGSREYSGRVLLSDVPSPPREVRTPAAGGRPTRWTRLPRRTGSARAVAPRTKIAVGRRRATAGGPPCDTAPARRLLPVPAARPRPVFKFYLRWVGKSRIQL